MHTIKCIIFDWDMCLFDTETLRPHVVKLIMSTLAMFDLPAGVREKAEALIRKDAPFTVVRECNLPPAVARALLDAYSAIEVPECVRTFGDEHHVADLPIEKILVTVGFERVQHAKIRRTGIGQMFTEIHVDALDYDGKHTGKEAIFRKIMAARGLAPRQVMVVGDNPHTELGAGKRIGMVTVQTLRPGVVRWNDAEHHVKSFSELPPIISGLAAMSRRRMCTPA